MRKVVVVLISSENTIIELHYVTSKSAGYRSMLDNKKRYFPFYSAFTLATLSFCVTNHDAAIVKISDDNGYFRVERTWTNETIFSLSFERTFWKRSMKHSISFHHLRYGEKVGMAWSKIGLVAIQLSS